MSHADLKPDAYVLKWREFIAHLGAVTLALNRIADTMEQFTERMSD